MSAGARSLATSTCRYPGRGSSATARPSRAATIRSPMSMTSGARSAKYPPRDVSFSANCAATERTASGGAVPPSTMVCAPPTSSGSTANCTRASSTARPSADVARAARAARSSRTRSDAAATVAAGSTVALDAPSCRTAGPVARPGLAAIPTKVMLMWLVRRRRDPATASRLVSRVRCQRRPRLPAT